MSANFKTSQDGTKAIVGINGGTQLQVSFNGDLEIAGKIKSQSGAALTSDSPLVVDVDSTAPALRVTQTGSGNAIVVEDSTNPDATPFIVNSSGNVQVGKDTLNPTVSINDRFTVVAQTTAANPFEGGLGVSFITNHNRTGSGSTLKLIKTKGTHDNPAATILGEEIGAISFLGYDGNRIQPVARVRCNGDTTTLPNPLLSSCPGYLWFETTPAASAIPVERMRIASNGNVGIGTTTPQAKLSVQGGSIYLNDGLNNVGIGDNVLANNTTGSDNTATGAGALFSNTIGHHNAAYGVNALRQNTIGEYNTAVGNRALSSNTTGIRNVAIGEACLADNTIADYNVAIGNAALRFNTTGYQNTAVGSTALYRNISGYANTAIGSIALHSNTTGLHNVAVGVSQASTTIGSQNTSIGNGSLGYNTTGNYNTAAGQDALLTNTTGEENAGFGTNSLENNTTGNYNTAVGSAALALNSTGNNNTCIGRYSGYDALLNITTQSNQVVIGNNNTTNATIKVAWTVPSDKRDKTNFGEVPHGLEFVNGLKPTAYQFRKNRDSEEPQEDTRVRYGFLAQDILALEGSNSVIIDNTDEEHLKYNESSLIPVLVNAIKELSAELTSVKAELAKLK